MTDIAKSMAARFADIKLLLETNIFQSDSSIEEVIARRLHHEDCSRSGSNVWLKSQSIDRAIRLFDEATTDCDKSKDKKSFTDFLIIY